MQPARTPADESIARFLLPRLIQFVTSNTGNDDPEQARSLVAHSLCQYVATVDKNRVPPAMALVVPTILSRAAAEGQDTYQEMSTRLLELAALDQGVFKTVVSSMGGGQRALLEEVIRSGQQASRASAQASSVGDSGQPTIALKMNFGS